MILNAPPTLMRIITRPEDSANLEPNEMARWWIEGRATQPEDSTNLAPNSLAARAARARWPRLRRTGKAGSAATPKGTRSRSENPCGELATEVLA